MRSIMSVSRALAGARAGGGILIVLVLLMCTSMTSAQVCEVYTDQRLPYPYIQDAIDNPACTEIILIVAGPGETFTGPGNRDIDYLGRAITIRSENVDPTSCIIDCEYLDRGFRFRNNETGTSILRGVTVRNGAGNYGGAIWCDNSSPSFINCIIESSVAIFEGGGEGGGVHCYPNSSPTFTDCIIRRNWTNGGGGGVSCYLNSSPTFENCHIDSNWAGYCGGGVSCSDNCSPEFTNCHIDSNSAGSVGGGVYCWSSTPSFSASCHIGSNSAGTNGGGVYCSGGEPSFTAACRVCGNTAGANGGGVYFEDTDPLTLTFANSFIEDNSAGDYGGGVYCDDSSPSFDSCFVRLNTAETDDGGGVYCLDSSSPTFMYCSIDSNSAHFRGGGVYCQNSSDPEFTSCSIETNTALSSAGGVYCDGSSPEFSECGIKYNTATSPTSTSGGVHCTNSSSPTFTRCRIDSNSADDYAGGILCQDYSAPTLDKCTIRGNSVSKSGGGVYSSSSASPTATNCIISDNVAGENGGGVLCNGAAGTFEFCTLSDNVAGGPDAKGGGVYCIFFSTTTFNSIIIAFSEGSGIYFKQSSGSQVEYCDFYGNTGGDIAFYNDDAANGPPVIGAISEDPLFVDREGGDFHLTDDSNCIGEANPADYPVDDFYEDNPRPDPFGSIPDIGADENGLSEPIAAVEDMESLLSGYALSQNWPNPFNPITRIEYALPDHCHVRLIIYTVLGERVITLVDEKQGPGHKVVQWDARSQSGNEVASGTYFYRLEANNYTELKKMLLLK